MCGVVSRPEQAMDRRLLRRSIVYFSLAGLAAGALAVLVAGASACAPGPNCLFLPEIQTAAKPTPGTIAGLAILGDSAQDEYQADNPRGGEYAATTMNWVEQLARFRSLDFGSWGTRPEPRRSGYAYNWARSGATSDDMITSGQHTGTAAQIRSGVVTHVAIQIGANDFLDFGMGIYNGDIAGDELTARLDEIVANIALATRTVHAASPRGVLLVAMQDDITLPIVPELRNTYRDPAGRQRVVDAFAYVNDELRKVAIQVGVPFFDYNAAMLVEVNSRIDNQGFLVVGGERVDLSRRGNEPHFGLLDDQYVHLGTVLSGLSANVYIRAFNNAFGTNIAPFSDQEILQAAGIVPRQRAASVPYDTPPQELE
jgi:hypothetical protein